MICHRGRPGPVPTDLPHSGQMPDTLPVRSYPQCAHRPRERRYIRRTGPRMKTYAGNAPVTTCAIQKGRNTNVSPPADAHRGDNPGTRLNANPRECRTGTYTESWRIPGRNAVRPYSATDTHANAIRLATASVLRNMSPKGNAGASMQARRPVGRSTGRKPGGMTVSAGCRPDVLAQVIPVQNARGVVEVVPHHRVAPCTAIADEGHLVGLEHAAPHRQLPQTHAESIRLLGRRQHPLVPDLRSFPAGTPSCTSSPYRLGVFARSPPADSASGTSPRRN